MLTEPLLPIRYYAYHRAGGAFAEIMVDVAPGKFRERRETPTGRTFRTTREADAAMRERNCP